MKRLIFFLFIFFIYSSGIMLADNPVLLNPVPTDNPPYPRAQVITIEQQLIL